MAVTMKHLQHMGRVSMRLSTSARMVPAFRPVAGPACVRHAHAAAVQGASGPVQALRLCKSRPVVQALYAQKTGLSTAAAPRVAAASGYKQPPEEILRIVDAPPQPSLSFSPDRTQILQISRPPSLPPLSELSRPELKLAGIRIDPDQLSGSRMGWYTDMAVVPASEMVPAPADRVQRITGYPEGLLLNYVGWSPEGKYIAFTTRSPGGPNDPPRAPLELWVAEAATGKAKKLASNLVTVFDSYSFVDDETIIACVAPEGRGPPPVRPAMPPGPNIQDNSSGARAQNRTFTDLLKDEHDSALLDYYGACALISIDVATGASKQIAPPRLYTEVDASPDGRYLMVSWIERPYSYSVPAGRFPAVVQLWRLDGSFVRELAALPLAENIPIAFNSVRVGPRSLSWRDDKPAEMSWIEAQDGGDPDVAVSPRDIMYTLSADDAAADPSAAPAVLATTDLRCGGVSWCDGDLAIMYESWWKTRTSKWWMIAPERRDEEKQLLFDRNYEDVYSDPGSPISRRTKDGTYILAKIDGQRKLLMSGGGASPEGSKPFLDLLDLDTKQTRRLWQSSPPYYESAGTLMNDGDGDEPITLKGLSMLLSRESAKDPPQTYIITFDGLEESSSAGSNGSSAPSSSGVTSTQRQLTNYPHPYPQLRDMNKEVLRYDREDGVTLTGTLYLPPGYDRERDGLLPVIMWAYPREFKSRDAAGQNRRSPHQFSGIGSMSPTLWLSRGYAVLDGPTFPIIAEGEAQPNDTYVEQLTSSARAAVAELVRRGVVDTSKVSVGGHSYGAFMTANLLAHCPDLFACGIARSGAYNRTLTPFGFQAEERTLWQTPETYMKMSPFMLADKFTQPLLLVHGMEDNNTGTFPLQSERFFAALKGHGAPARLVLLPHEGHGYRARESVLHTLYEQDQWLERHAGFGRLDEDYVASTGGTVSSTDSTGTVTE